MAASVRIEDEAFGDARFLLLGKLLGTNEYDALGRMAWLWRHCTQRHAYVLSEALVATIVLPDALVQAELGERVEEGIRVRGTRGRIEWLRKVKRNSKKGGAKTRAKWQANSRPTGQPTGPRPAIESEGPPSPAPALSTAPSTHPPSEGVSAPPMTPDSNLVQRWMFAKKFGGPASVHEVAAMLDNLHQAGITDEEIIEEIGNPKRNRGEFPNQFADRMLKRSKRKRQDEPEPYAGIREFVNREGQANDQG